MLRDRSYTEVRVRLWKTFVSRVRSVRSRWTRRALWESTTRRWMRLHWDNSWRVETLRHVWHTHFVSRTWRVLRLRSCRWCNLYWVSSSPRDSVIFWTLQLELEWICIFRHCLMRFRIWFRKSFETCWIKLSERHLQRLHLRTSVRTVFSNVGENVSRCYHSFIYHTSHTNTIFKHRYGSETSRWTLGSLGEHYTWRMLPTQHQHWILSWRRIPLWQIPNNSTQIGRRKHSSWRLSERSDDSASCKTSAVQGYRTRNQHIARTLGRFKTGRMICPILRVSSSIWVIRCFTTLHLR